MKKLFLLSALFIGINSYSQSGKHIAGLTGGFTMPWKNGLYINTDFGKAWPDSERNPVIGAFYEYQASTHFKFGAHFEYEKSEVEIDHIEYKGNVLPEIFDEDISFKRKAFGVTWLGHYPDYMLRLELGGYTNFAFASSNDWDDKMKGIEYGIIVGPAVAYEPLVISLHFKPSFSYLYSSGEPEDVLLYYPRLMFKLAYVLPNF